MENPLGLNGIEFIEFASPQPERLDKLFTEFGFSKIMRHRDRKIDLYRQGDITFLVNGESRSFAHGFTEKHGPCVPSMAWRVRDPDAARSGGIARGAGAAAPGLADYRYADGAVPALMGIGDSLIYLTPDDASFDQLYGRLGFVPHPEPSVVKGKGFLIVDHLTNNVEQGTMARWSDFYKRVFGFVEVKYFDIRGAKTGLTSFALRSPCAKFCIPINEGSESKSQINEYLREYRGPGVQHIAFLTGDIVSSLEAMRGSSVETLDIDNEYYQEVFQRVPNVTEDHRKLQDLQILVDGDAEGYLLQIFTRNVIGPIFIEIIQRKNHHAFGEGNFGALFRSIERDQERRGVL